MTELNKYGELEPDASGCPRCGAPVKPEWKVCPNCAERLAAEQSKCAECGTLLRSDWKACPECGTRIGSLEGANRSDSRSSDDQPTDVRTRFREALNRGDYAIAAEMLNAGADIDADDPLWCACVDGDFTRVTWLVEHGAEVDHINGAEETPLWAAAFTTYDEDKKQACLRIMKYLISKGANVNYRATESGCSLIRVAGSPEAARLLRNHGAIGPSYLEEHGD